MVTTPVARSGRIGEVRARARDFNLFRVRRDFVPSGPRFERASGRILQNYKIFLYPALVRTRIWLGPYGHFGQIGQKWPFLIIFGHF